MRVCQNCKKRKKLSSFGPHNSRKDGMQPWCKLCTKKYHARRRSNTDWKKAYNGKKRTCSRCHKTFPKTKSFWNASNSAKDGLNASCRRCDNLSRHYGINSQEVDTLYGKQNEKCAICQRHHTLRYLHVDHDHAVYLRKHHGLGTKEQRRKSVRGLLCSPCNKSLGWYELINPSLKSKWEIVEDYLTNPPAKFLWEQ